ncbi:MAG: glucose-6-phosphate isomerase [Cyanobacteriota bacterium]
MATISFDYSNSDVSAVGEEHGINLNEAFKSYESKMSQWVSEIWEDSKVKGKWLAWMNLADNDKLLTDIIAYAESVKGKFDNVVILGIGGSALGGIAVAEALLKPFWNTLSKEERNGYPKIFFLDNIDPDQISGLIEVLDFKKTLVNVISKSGTTAETMSQYIIFHKLLKETCKEHYKKHIVVTTDNEKGVLRRLVDKEGFVSFPVPDDVGGRFSVFSAVGLLPLALVGIDITKLFEGIKAIVPMMKDGNIKNNIAAQNALIHYLMDTEKDKSISVCMPYSSRLRYISDWYCQLWAESLGKEKDLDGNTINCGQTPVKTLGATDQHSQIQLYNEGPNDKIITFIRVGNFDNNLVIPSTDVPELEYMSEKTVNDLINAEADATRVTLTGYNRPNITITLPQVNEYYLSQIMFIFEVQTALAGKLYNIDPFDQPGVEQAKNYTYALMGRKGYEKVAKELKGLCLKSH